MTQTHYFTCSTLNCHWQLEYSLCLVCESAHHSHFNTFEKVNNLFMGLLNLTECVQDTKVYLKLSVLIMLWLSRAAVLCVMQPGVRKPVHWRSLCIYTHSHIAHSGTLHRMKLIHKKTWKVATDSNSSLGFTISSVRL